MPDQVCAAHRPVPKRYDRIHYGGLTYGDRGLRMKARQAVPMIQKMVKGDKNRRVRKEAKKAMKKLTKKKRKRKRKKKS